MESGVIACPKPKCARSERRSKQLRWKQRRAGHYNNPRNEPNPAAKDAQGFLPIRLSVVFPTSWLQIRAKKRKRRVHQAKVRGRARAERQKHLYA